MPALPRLLLRLTPLVTVILIDSISYTIVVPIFAAALLSDTPILMTTSSASTRYVVYGVSLGIFELVMLYMAPVLGEISDRSGRRRVLLFCLGGVILSFALIGAAFAFNLVALLLLGRILGGATAASQSVAQAAAVDLSNAETKSTALSFCLFASSVGFIVGPLIGGGLSGGGTMGLADIALPICVTIGLAVAGLALIFVGYRDANRPRAIDTPREGIDWLMGIRGFREAVLDPTIRNLICIFGLMQAAWGTYFLFYPSLLYERFDVDTRTVALIMGLFGIGFCIAYGLCLPLIEKRLPARTIAAWSLWATAALMLVSILSYDLAVQWAVAFPIAVTVSVGYGAIITMFSNAVDDRRQGWILGMSISVTALAWGVSSILAGMLSGLSYIAPFVLALASLVISAAVASLRAPTPVPHPRIEGERP